MYPLRNFNDYQYDELYDFLYDDYCYVIPGVEPRESILQPPPDVRLTITNKVYVEAPHPLLVST
ncbi:MAG: hypothetical protein Hyperionvirus1_38 [Hyperionvirus sp.]|uniref:Uncharacterized protein n=1 Tax=Hyperionvirus sp. TaxID=2487770 RepID=A0A3G5AAU6_9VIRU|nr:MAG: hypothetical protein Hyperionvirus1_38 [Hyperionvirus sp.]